MTGPSLIEHFAALRDPRQSWKVLYPLAEILLLVLCGTLAGAEDFVEIRRWGHVHQDFLRRFLPFAAGILSHDTLNDVINAIDGALFAECFTVWVDGLRGTAAGLAPEVVAIDGKTSRRTHDHARDRGPLHMVSAWASSQRARPARATATASSSSTATCVASPARGNSNTYLSPWPISLEELPALLASGRLPIDVAMLQVSPPDARGFVSLGVSVDLAPAVLGVARRVIAEVNPAMPRTHGESFVHVDRFDALVEVGTPVTEYRHPRTGDTAAHVARYIAAIIEDGSTLQIGLGRVPNDALRYLTDRRDLGIHSDVITDGVVGLVEAGVVTGRRKTHQPAPAAFAASPPRSSGATRT